MEVFFIKVDYWCNIQKSVPYELIIEGDSIQFCPLRGDVTARSLQFNYGSSITILVTVAHDQYYSVAYNGT